MACDLLLRQVRFAICPFDGAVPSRLGWLALICGTLQYGAVFERAGGESLRAYLDMRSGRGKFLPRSATPESLKLIELPEAERGGVAAYLAFIENGPELLSSTLAPWSDLIGALRQAWGDCPAFDRIAFLSAGIRSKTDLGADGDLGPADNIVSTARFARLKSGAPHWWHDRLSEISGADSSARWLLLLWLWATPRTLIKLSVLLDQLLNNLSSKDWANLSREFYLLSTFVRKVDDASGIAVYELYQFESLGSRLCSFVGQRLSLKPQLKLAMTIAHNKSAEAPEVQFALEAVVKSCLTESSWRDALDTIRALYLRGAYIPLGVRRTFEVPADVANEVSRQSESFPLPLVAAADSALRVDAGSKAVGLQTIAVRDKWFR
jgi:hypothetical protein